MPSINKTKNLEGNAKAMSAEEIEKVINTFIIKNTLQNIKLLRNCRIDVKELQHINNIESLIVQKVLHVEST